ncbi:hypothetical protein PRIPAC_73786 [Pristionchus pacificus]|uniref:Uncharacterized protein n=1 Tax=Pristionchus pacificus TaxID=54126 RepID=A0A2A6BGM0_PRIPA|nr:hypothetical protein PRIPAC_73786 [Pristionchus pacificus]|eukprot:PDM65034.1 hypothetical protein PRIPAC_53290 [Pristionchus pacificus]
MGGLLFILLLLLNSLIECGAPATLDPSATPSTLPSTAPSTSETAPPTLPSTAPTTVATTTPKYTDCQQYNRIFNAAYCLKEYPIWKVCVKVEKKAKRTGCTLPEGTRHYPTELIDAKLDM